MRTEDLFKYGVTPKNEIKVGEEIWAKHGDRLEVQSIGREDLVVNYGKKPIKVLTEEVELWQEPKTLFEDDSIESTWGNLKKAMESAGLGDETKFAVHDFIGFREAVLRKEKLQDNHGHEKTYIIVE